MSSFIVSEKTINSFLAYFKTEEWTKIAKVLQLDLDTYQYEQVGRLLMTMNCEAVGLRYLEAINKNAIKEYTYYDFRISFIQAFKSLNCFLYQCCESGIPESELYKALKEIENKWCWKIAMDLKEYENAEWDIPDSILKARCNK